MPIDQWLTKAKNSDQEFEIKAGDDKNEINRKESLKRWYDQERFLFSKQYQPDAEILMEPEKIYEYIKDALSGKIEPKLDNHENPKAYKNI